MACGLLYRYVCGCSKYSVYVYPDRQDYDSYTPLPYYHPHSTLLATSCLLPPPPSLREVGSVAQWLEVLQLPQLAGKFEGLTLKKISKLWDIELTSVSTGVGVA